MSFLFVCADYCFHRRLVEWVVMYVRDNICEARLGACCVKEVVSGGLVAFDKVCCGFMGEWFEQVVFR